MGADEREKLTKMILRLTKSNRKRIFARVAETLEAQENTIKDLEQENVDEDRTRH